MKSTRDFAWDKKTTSVVLPNLADVALFVAVFVAWGLLLTAGAFA